MPASNLTLTFRRCDRRYGWAAVGDPRPARSYEVWTGDVLLGWVETRSSPNMIRPRGLRYTTGQRGYSRQWIAHAVAGGMSCYHYTRGAAAARLLEGL